MNDAQLQMSGAVPGSRYAFSRAGITGGVAAGSSAVTPGTSGVPAPRLLASVPHTPTAQTRYSSAVTPGAKYSSYGGSGLTFGGGGGGGAPSATAAVQQASAFKAFTPATSGPSAYAARASYDEVASSVGDGAPSAVNDHSNNLAGRLAIG